MTKPRLNNPLLHLRASDLRAVAQLATQATSGVVRVAEGVHQSVWSALGVPGGNTAGKTRGITGLVYRSIQGSTQLLGKGLDTVLARLQPVLATADHAKPETPQREAVLSALNGVLGDRLMAGGNPLATRMTLRYAGAALDWGKSPPMPDATGKVLLLIHGLCMNDLQWQTRGGDTGRSPATDVAQQPGHGEALAVALGYTPVYLRYNTGLHVSQNGRELSRQLEQLMRHWPTPLTELAVLAHSMGGLVIRSAVHSARQQGLHWPQHLKNIVFLGTPHHGAPLERAGSWIDALLGSTPYSAPFAKLTQLRSAGITDLRYGHVTEMERHGQDRFQRGPDTRPPVPLPEGIACYAVAATLAGKRSLVADRLTGDGLVPLRSALGQHDDPTRTLAFDKSAQYIAYRTSHLELLRSRAVTGQIGAWLAPAKDRSAAPAS